MLDKSLFDTFVYILVIDKSLCLNNFWICLISTPDSSKCVANECLNMWGVTFIPIFFPNSSKTFWTNFLRIFLFYLLKYILFQNCNYYNTLTNLFLVFQILIILSFFPFLFLYTLYFYKNQCPFFLNWVILLILVQKNIEFLLLICILDFLLNLLAL